MLTDRPDQLYLHSNVPALVAIFIRFRRRGARTAGGAAAGRPRRAFGEIGWMSTRERLRWSGDALGVLIMALITVDRCPDHGRSRTLNACV